MVEFWFLVGFLVGFLCDLGKVCGGSLLGRR